MSILKWPDKDPDERLDYALDWSPALNPSNDEIISSLWFVVDDDHTLTIESDGVDGHITYVWLTKGKDRRNYQLTNRVHTAGGRIFDRSVMLAIIEK